MNFRDRTMMSEAFERYIPAFEYCLVELNRYPAEHILRFKDELAVLMLVDKMDFKNKEGFLKDFPGYMKEMALNIPESLATLMGDVITVLLNRLEIPEEQIRAMTDLVRKKEVGRMFDHVVESYFERMQIVREEGILIGTEKGREARDLEIARNALSEGASVEFVRKITGLTPETIEALR
jgi:hypothetical protein